MLELSGSGDGAKTLEGILGDVDFALGSVNDKLAAPLAPLVVNHVALDLGHALALLRARACRCSWRPGVGVGAGVGVGVGEARGSQWGWQK